MLVGLNAIHNNLSVVESNMAADEKEEQASSKPCSPLLGMLSMLRLFGGFPINLSTNPPKMDIFRPLAIPAYILFSCWINTLSLKALMGEEKGYFETLTEFANFFKLPMTDMVMHFTFLLIDIGLSLALFVLYCLKRRDIAELYQQLHMINSYDTLPDEKACGRKLRCHVYTGLIGALVMAFGAGAAAGVSSQAYGDRIAEAFGKEPAWGHWLSLLNYSSIVFLGAMNPLVVAVVILFLDLAHTFGRILTAWTKRVENASKRRHNNILVYEAKVLCNLGDSVNEVLSPFLIFLQFYLLIFGVLATYGAAGILTKFSYLFGKGEELAAEPVPGLMSLSFAMLVPVYVGALKGLGGIGTQIIIKADRAAMAMEDAYPENLQASTLASRLRQWCKFRPYDAYEVSNANNVGLLGSLLTFMIVLLQFRVSETSAQ